MLVKEAVEKAKEYVKSLFAEEGIGDVGLEEVDFDEKVGVWAVTIGFTRAWDRSGPLRPQRAFKVVTISDADAKVLSVKHRVSMVI